MDFLIKPCLRSMDLVPSAQGLNSRTSVICNYSEGLGSHYGARTGTQDLIGLFGLLFKSSQTRFKA